MPARPAKPRREYRIISRADLATVAWLMRNYVRSYGLRLVVAAFCAAASAAATGALIVLIRPIFDDVLLGSRADALALIAFQIIGLSTLGGLALYAQAVLAASVNERVNGAIMGDLHDTLVHSDQAELDRLHTGDIVVMCTGYVGAAASGLTSGLIMLIRDLVQAAVLVTVMIRYDWQMSLLLIISFPLLLLGVGRLSARIRGLLTTGMISMQRAGRMMVETVAGARIVKLHGAEAGELRRFQESVDERTRLARRLARLSNVMSPINELIGGLVIAGIIVAASWRARYGGPSLGEIATFLGAMVVANQPLKRISGQLLQMQTGLVSAAMVRDMLEKRPTIVDRQDSRPCAVTEGTVAFEGVTFGYDPARPVLHDIDLTARRGRVVALVGPSGGGKSTLLALLARFYEPLHGRITIDGADIRDVTLRSLRDTMAYVGQDPVLFDETIRFNIAYGRPEATDGEIMQAVELAGARPFIDALPLGLDTRVGERGAQLSGGQRQRIALARAILRGAPILLLDEATASLDNESERAVRSALRVVARDKTVILVAHRMASVFDADIIHVIDGGRIIESGSHDELVARGGLYAALHATQVAA
jgi:ATP-binding cassette, subfamily B, bacterial MsbA